MHKSEIGKGKDRAVHNRNQHTITGTPMPHGITQCYLPLGSGDFLTFTQPKLVLDLAIPERFTTELTWVVLISQDSLLEKGGYLSKK